MSTSSMVGVLGSINFDTVVGVARIPGRGETVAGVSVDTFPGGKGLNQAVAAARSGAPVKFFGAVGDDDAGPHLLDVFHTEGIDTDGVITAAHPTGRAFVTVETGGGENAIVVVPGANAAVGVPEQRCDVLLAQLEVPIDVVGAAFCAAQAVGSITILNPAPATELPDELIEASDVVIPNEHELELVGGSDRLLARGCTAVIVTKGAAGADLVTADATVHIPPTPVTPIDTTGAGDAFCGSFAARIAAGDDFESAARWASVAGAIATTVRGAVPSQPHAEAIRKRLSASRG